jgi:hypothetical protein
MLLLGRDWRAFDMPSHEVETYWEAPMWRSRCSCAEWSGEGNVKWRLEVLAGEHVKKASA